jgi:hypothetical protein
MDRREPTKIPQDSQNPEWTVARCAGADERPVRRESRRTTLNGPPIVPARGNQ